MMYQDIFDNTRDGLLIIDAETQRVVEANAAACAMYGYLHPEFIGMHAWVIVDPASREAHLDYLHSVCSGAGDEAQLVHIRRDGARFDVELHGSAFLYQDRLCVLSVVRDISPRVRNERRLQSRVEERQREQATLLEISKTLASALELQPGLILDQMRGIIDFTHAGLFVLDGQVLAALALRGMFRLEAGQSFQMQLASREIQAALFNQHQPTRIEDVWSEEPAARVFRSLLGDQAAQVLGEVRSWMWVPLVEKRRLIGVVGVGHTRVDAFTAHHADLALTVANQAAIAMVNAELYEQARALAALEERQRLARNLHDAVNQSLFSASLIAEVLPRLWEQDPEKARQSLEDLRRLTRGAQADMRLLLAELRPATLTDAELGDLLRILANALEGRLNIPVRLTLVGKEASPAAQGKGALPPDLQMAFYRLCQEALSNIAKHAGAGQVDIELRYTPGAVELQIRDDGVGFDPAQDRPGHYGLSMMRERAAAAGADLSIISRPGEGALVVIHWDDPQERKVNSV